MIDPTVLEAIAGREALTQAEDLGLQHLHVASDCKEVVNGIRDGTAGSFGGIIKEIQERKKAFISCNFVHEFRATNYEAHKIARLGTLLPQGRHI